MHNVILAFTGCADVMPEVLFHVQRKTAKVHNIGLALKALQMCNKETVLMRDGTAIQPQDIIDGHREKTLGLLWNVALHCQVVGVDLSTGTHATRRNCIHKRGQEISSTLDMGLGSQHRAPCV